MAINDELNEANQSSSELNENLKNISEEAVRAEATFRDISKSMKDLAKSSPDVASAIENAARNQQALARSASKVAKFSTADLKDKKLANDFAKESAKNASLRQRTESDISFLQSLRIGATEKEAVVLDQVLEKLQSGSITSEELAEFFDEIVQANDELNRKTSFFDALSSTLATIPGLGPALSGPFAKASRELRIANIEGKNLFEKAKITAEAFGSIALTGLVASLFKADSATTNLAKQLSISKDEARDLRSGFDAIARDSGVSALNSLSMAESMIQLGDTIGATAGFTDQQVIAQTKLTKMVGLQGEESAKLAEFGILNEKSTNNVTTGILEQVALLEQETGIRLEGRKILSQVAAANGQLAAQYGFNTKELARAVVQSNRLGLSLEQSQAAASGLLDFESSISNELSAELLTGKNLNLERARSLALQGKSAEAAAEIANQMGSASEFAEMNVIQQESLAKAANMSVAELADVLKKQEVLSALGEENFDTLMQTEEGRKRINEIGGEQLLQQLEQQSAADKFQQAVEKIQASLGTIVEGPLGGLIDGMASLASSAGVVYTTLGLIGAVSLAKAIGSLSTLAFTILPAAAAGAITTASAITFGLGLAAIVAGIAYMTTQSKKAKQQLTTKDDMIMPAGYGDRIISSPKGTIALNNQDTIVAGTNLGQGSNNQESKRTNSLLETLIMQNNKKQKISPVGLYHIQ